MWEISQATNTKWEGNHIFDPEKNFFPTRGWSLRWEMRDERWDESRFKLVQRAACPMLTCMPLLLCAERNVSVPLSCCCMLMCSGCDLVCAHLQFWSRNITTKAKTTLSTLQSIPLLVWLFLWMIHSSSCRNIKIRTKKRISVCC